MMFKPFTWRTNPQDHFAKCKCHKCDKLRSIDPSYDNKVNPANPFGENLGHGKWFGVDWEQSG